MKASPRRPLSVVIIACNEEHRIAGCLDSVYWADEIVIVHNGSTDSTLEVAKKYTDRIFFIPWRGYGPQKQAAVDLATHDMILNVDCDERVTPELAQEIGEILGRDDVPCSCAISRRTFIGSKEIKHCGWYPDRKVRLFDRTKARFSDDLVHEAVIAEGKIHHCRQDLLHYSFTGMSDLITKMNRFTDIAASQMLQRGRRAGIFHITMRPVFAFLKTYFFKLGFLDGIEGLEVAVSNSVSVFYKYAKLRELRAKKE